MSSLLKSVGKAFQIFHVLGNVKFFDKLSFAILFVAIRLIKFAIAREREREREREIGGLQKN